jgi:hypothetical protein
VADAGDDDVGSLALDLVVERREIAGVRREAHVIENLHADPRQALEIFRIERRGPRRVLAEDHGCLDRKFSLQRLPDRVANRIRDEA